MNFDNCFIWCAADGKADAIVSGEEHLLGLKRTPVPVLAVSEIIQLLRA